MSRQCSFPLQAEAVGELVEVIGLDDRRGHLSPVCAIAPIAERIG